MHFYSLQIKHLARRQYYDKNSFWVGKDRMVWQTKALIVRQVALFETTVKYNGEISSACKLSVHWAVIHIRIL